MGIVIIAYIIDSELIGHQMSGVPLYLKIPKNLIQIFSFDIFVWTRNDNSDIVGSQLIGQ